MTQRISPMKSSNHQSPSSWWMAATAVSMAWSAVSAVALSYHWWNRPRRDNRNKMSLTNNKENEDDDQETTTTPNILWNKTSENLWNPSLLLALLAGAGSFVLKRLVDQQETNVRGQTSLALMDEASHWLSWSSGLLALWAIQRPNAEGSKRCEENSLLWPFLYVAFFPGSQQRGTWALASILGVQQLWLNFHDKESTQDEASNCPSPPTVLEDPEEVESSTDITTDSKADDIAPPPPQLRDKSIEQELKNLLVPVVSRNQDSLPKPASLPSGAPTADSTITPPPPSATSKAAVPPKQYLEILVHNVSHTDLVLSIDTSSSSSTESDNNQTHSASSRAADSSGEKDETETAVFCLCRPRFSFFDHYCQSLLNNMTQDETIVSFNRYQRSTEDPRYNILNEPANSVPLPTGLLLDTNGPQAMADLSTVRVRGRDQARVNPNGGPDPHHSHQPNSSDEGNGTETPTSHLFPINYVFFPLLACLLPRWEAQILDKQYGWGAVKRVLILVSGVGTPRNWTHSVKGNSTQACADLMEQFVKRLDPGITVVKIHSETNIFRYDENLLFVQQELMPVLNAYRDSHAHKAPYPDEQQATTTNPAANYTASPFDVDWRKSLAVTLSFADGSPARTFAIQAGLRPYRPTFFHFWQLKSFWHENKIVDDDLDVYSFEAMETSPAIDIHHLTDPQLQLVVEEMTKFKDEMIESLQKDNKTNDMKKFWLRKTKKPVLAVLLVHDGEGKPILYRGTNMEVSMPTGSLCAERNVIGSALAANPDLKREHLRMIAVLAVPLPPTEEHIQLPGGGASTMGDGGGGEEQGPIALLKRVGSTASFGATTFAGSYSDLNNNFNDRKASLGSETDNWGAAANTVQEAEAGPRRAYSFSEAVSSAAATATDDGDSSAPLRKIALYPPSHTVPTYTTSSTGKPPLPGSSTNLETGQSTPTNRKKTQRRMLVVVQSSRDLNPLKPCGACNEWLKKIAECNPYFQVVTFTDANCNGVYCAPCQE